MNLVASSQHGTEDKGILDLKSVNQILSDMGKESSQPLLLTILEGEDLEEIGSVIEAIIKSNEVSPETSRDMLMKSASMFYDQVGSKVSRRCLLNQMNMLANDMLDLFRQAKMLIKAIGDVDNYARLIIRSSHLEILSVDLERAVIQSYKDGSDYNMDEILRSYNLDINFDCRFEFISWINDNLLMQQ